MWICSDGVKLIESLLLNIPVRRCFSHRCRKVGSRGREAALDVDMVVRAERVSSGQAFKLSGLEVYHELNGKTFDELNETFQEIILDYR